MSFDGDINTMGNLNLYIKESLLIIQKQCTTSILTFLTLLFRVCTLTTTTLFLRQLARPRRRCLVTLAV